MGTTDKRAADTCKRYLRSLEGLQSANDHAKTKAVVDEFLKNEGQELHQKLQEYAKDRQSYIEEFWDESYLGHEESLVLALNPFFILESVHAPCIGGVS